MKEIIISVCILSLILSVFKWLTPDGEMKKITVFFVSLVFLSCLTSLFNKDLIKFNKTLPSFSENKEYLSVYENSAVPVIKAVLSENGINTQKIEVKADKTENGSIVISKVTVYTKEDKKSEIEKIINNETNALAVEVKSVK